jgi:MFS family permease
MLFVGYGSITFNSMAKTVLQLAATPEMRGRVMALWGLAWLGSTPIGGPIVGWVGQEAGARWSLVVGGLPTLVIGLLALPVLVRIDRRRGAGVAVGRGSAGLAPLISPERTRGSVRSARSRVSGGDEGSEYHHRVEVMPGGVVERPAAGDKP